MTKAQIALKVIGVFLVWLWWGIVKPMGTPLKGLRETLEEVSK